MEIRDYEELEKKLCKELEEMKNHKNLDMGDIEVIDKLTHSIKSIHKIMEDDGYSQGMYSRDGMWNANGSYGRNYGDYNSNDGGYNRGNSYARHYVRGHYSRGEEDLSDSIREMMERGNLSMSDKNTLERAMEILRK